MAAFWRWLYITGKAYNTGKLAPQCLRGGNVLEQRLFYKKSRNLAIVPKLQAARVGETLSRLATELPETLTLG